MVDYRFDPRENRNPCSCGEVYDTYEQPDTVRDCSEPGCEKTVCVECVKKCAWCLADCCPSHVVKEATRKGSVNICLDCKEKDRRQSAEVAA